jgi:hypothetical protein
MKIHTNPCAISLGNEHTVRMFGLETSFLKVLLGLFRHSGHRVHVLATGLGFEPRCHGPEPCILPLDDPVISICKLILAENVLELKYGSL